METISYTTQKARKEHTCDWCNEKINIGETYAKAFCKEDDVYVWKNHIQCEKIAQELKMFDNGPCSESEFYETIREEYQRIMSEKHNDSYKSKDLKYPDFKIYESKDFKIPTFKEQLDFVCSFHGIK